MITRFLAAGLMLGVFSSHILASDLNIDFRSDHSRAGAKILTDEQQQNLFARLYSGSNECLQGDMDGVRGSFTAPNQRQSVITFKSWKNCDQTGSHGNIVLMQGGDLLTWTNSEKVKAERIEAVVDINNDGVNEVVVSLTDGDQGLFNTFSSTISFKDGKILFIISYLNGLVRRDACAAPDSAEKTYAALFEVKNGNASQTNFTSLDCYDWKFFSAGSLNVKPF